MSKYYTNELTPAEDAEIGSPTADQTKRHRGDQVLRDHGFKIASRPKNKIDLWEREEHLYTTAEATALCQK